MKKSRTFQENMIFFKKNVLMFFLHIQCYNGFILEYEKSTPGSSFMFYKEADDCVCMCACTKTLLVSQLVCYSESQWEARVLANAATAMRLTHSRHMRQTQGFTRCVDGCADVLSVERRRQTVGHISEEGGEAMITKQSSFLHFLRTHCTLC